MGQRSQLIVRIPELFYREGNPNNQGERVQVYHNQWLYGRGFICYLKRLMEATKILTEQRKDMNMGGIDYKEIVDKAILHANNADILSMTNTSDYYGKEKRHNYNLDLSSKSVKEFIEEWDNNNGFMYLAIADNGSLSFFILNGMEDEDEIKNKTSKEYLNQFYEDEKVTDKNVWDSIEYLNKCKQVDVFDDLKKLKKIVEKGIVKQVAVEL